MIAMNRDELTPEDPRSPLAFHRTAQLSALTFASSAYHPPSTHHDLPAGYDDAFIRIGVLDIILFTDSTS